MVTWDECVQTGSVPAVCVTDRLTDMSTPVTRPGSAGGLHLQQLLPGEQRQPFYHMVGTVCNCRGPKVTSD